VVAVLSVQVAPDFSQHLRGESIPAPHGSGYISA
jgi:hypothetical protein